MQKQKLLLLGWLLSLLFFAAPATVYGQGKGQLPTSLIVFGDSIVDAGNNNDLKTIIKCNYPPYGRDFKAKMPTGRFSNGKIVNDIIASLAGITDSLMAYLDPNLEDRDLLHGVTFASGGAGLDDVTSNFTNVISLAGQVELFKEYMGRLRRVAGEGKANEIITIAQYVLMIGSNDVNTYFTVGLRKRDYDIDSYTSFLVDKAAEFAKTIYDLGARRIGISGLPPLGCVPFVRTIAGGITRQCAEPYNEASLMFNNKLRKKMQSLTNSLDGSFLLYMDVYNPFMELIQNPKKYGFEEATSGCCGSGNVEVTYMCNTLDPRTCPDSTKYVFWDSFHPTEKAYRLLLNQTVASLLPLLQR
ncbi:GDSL esterase/lipase [Nymphaea thermarum]|nr:GDSL esterase/lipase [Nymphaea thermarum]